MKDRFAAQWDSVGERHKGTRIGTLWAKLDNGTGDATITVQFLEEMAITRADILQDIIGVLQREYGLAVAMICQPEGI